MNIYLYLAWVYNKINQIVTNWNINILQEISLGEYFMIETVVSSKLSVDENLIIKKNRIISDEKHGDMKRICIVTGLHGDELEGQYVCYELIKAISNNIENLDGIVDIYPTLNPLGIDTVKRGMPTFDLDMNRIFPGSQDGAMAEYMAAKVIEDIKDADMCIDLHSSNIFLKEAPQVRISEETKETLLPYAKLINTDFIWIQKEKKVQQSTLVYNLNKINVPTLMVEMGVGMRITKEYCFDLVNGILNIMKELGMWRGNIKEVKDPIIASDDKVTFINSNSSGIFIPSADHWKDIKEGEVVGEIIDVLHGELLEKIVSPCNGRIFTLREYPVVYEGSLIARILKGGF